MIDENALFIKILQRQRKNFILSVDAPRWKLSKTAWWKNRKVSMNLFFHILCFYKNIDSLVHGHFSSQNNSYIIIIFIGWYFLSSQNVFILLVNTISLYHNFPDLLRNKVCQEHFTSVTSTCGDLEIVLCQLLLTLMEEAIGLLWTDSL